MSCEGVLDCNWKLAEKLEDGRVRRILGEEDIPETLYTRLEASEHVRCEHHGPMFHHRRAQSWVNAQCGVSIRGH
jgi:hypothetical protein